MHVTRCEQPMAPTANQPSSSNILRTRRLAALQPWVILEDDLISTYSKPLTSWRFLGQLASLIMAWQKLEGGGSRAWRSNRQGPFVSSTLPHNTARVEASG